MVRLIAADLDGTLLTTDKRLTERTERALRTAAEQGILIVPATGRILAGMPEEILRLPWIRYMILANGAMVWDREAETCLYRAEMSVETGLGVMAWLEGYPVIYDCYQDGQGWMTASMWEKAEAYAPSPFYLNHIRTLRKPVPELKAFLRGRGIPLQKIQAFCRTEETQQEILEKAAERFPGLAVSSSVTRNVEINDGKANKGAALLTLAEKLGIAPEETAAFGDGSNDLSMIRAAGTGIAMGNAVPPVKAAADRVTAGNDEDGVAVLAEELTGQTFP